MTGGTAVRWPATLSDSRAQAAIEARRFGVPLTMIEAATRRRSAGDWRGACAAADVEVRFNPDTIRRRHGSRVVGRLLDDLRDLAPDLLRWHMPRVAHGVGRLQEGLLVPLAGYATDDGHRLTLTAATPRFALAAGERIVLVVLDSDRRRRQANMSSATRAVLDGVHRKSFYRYSLLHHRMFWDAAQAPLLAQLCVGLLDAATTYADTAGGIGARVSQEIASLQDSEQTAAAWSAAGIDLSVAVTRASAERMMRWLAAIPVNLPTLLDQVRTVLPDADSAAIRAGGGTIALHGLGRTGSRVSARIAPANAARGLPIVPEAAWSRPVDADLLRLGLLQPNELHPLVAAALAPGLTDERAATAATADPNVSDYRAVPGIEAVDVHTPGSAAIRVRCGADMHRITQIDGRWQAVDHNEQAARETLLAALGGRPNPCRAAVDHLSSGRHVIDLIDPLLAHGRADEAVRLLREHVSVDALAAAESVPLPDGHTVGELLDALRENTLRMRMILSGALPARCRRATRAAHCSAIREVPTQAPTIVGAPERGTRPDPSGDHDTDRFPAGAAPLRGRRTESVP